MPAQITQTQSILNLPLSCANNEWRQNEWNNKKCTLSTWHRYYEPIKFHYYVHSYSLIRLLWFLMVRNCFHIDVSTESISIWLITAASLQRKPITFYDNRSLNPLHSFRFRCHHILLYSMFTLKKNSYPRNLITTRPTSNYCLRFSCSNLCELYKFNYCKRNYSKP